MDLELTSDQEFFAETTRKFLGARVPASELRALRNDAAGFDKAYWEQGAELGWTSLLVSEEDGGGSISGRPLSDLSLVAFEFGRHAAPGPLIPSNVVAAALSRVGSGAQRAEVLPGLLSGEAIGSWGYTEPRPHSALGDIATVLSASGGQLVLNGIKAPVEAGAQADHFLVTAITAGAEQGLTQVLVPASAPGVRIQAMHSVDLTLRFAEVTFDNVELPESALVGELGHAQAQVDWQLQVAIALDLAEMVGAMETAFEMAKEWAFDRYSFGRPLASYQELKHRFADMKLWLEASHAIADGALHAVERDASESWDLLSAGKAYIGHYGVELVQDCVQMHGGIGVTFDHDMHLYLRRVVLGSRIYGSVTEHRARLTAALEKSSS